MTKHLSITSLLADYRAGHLKPRHVLEELAERDKAANNPAIWIHKLSQQELEPYLVRLEQTKPEHLPLYGIPFAIKDNIDLAGVPTTAACPSYGYLPQQSAPVVQRLLDAGAIPIGKTNLDQFATGLVGVRSPYGVPRNPRAPLRIPGGSSSGSAVALAEGLVSFSLGTDTAGSGRVPAAFNQLWGMKPSRGRLSTRGVVPACRTLDCVSVFAHSLDDLRRVLEVAEGYDAHDPFSQPLRNVKAPPSRRIGIPRQEQLLFFGDAGYEAAWEDALADLSRKGWETVTIDFQPFLDAARLLYDGPWVAERYTALETFLNTHPQDWHEVTRKIISTGSQYRARDCYAAMYRLAELKRNTDNIWGQLAAIITPTVGGFPTLAQVQSDPLGPNAQLGYYTNFMNLLDLCAIAMPAQQPHGGLPFGITWIAPRDHDHHLLSIAADQPPNTEAGQAEERLSILLFGAHMSGLPLNGQIQALDGQYLGTVQTAPSYRMIYLSEPAPHRPGIIRTAQGGTSLEAEEWSLPRQAIGELLASIRHPLGLGEVELLSGRMCHGFLCEACAIKPDTPDISQHGSWRSFLRGGDFAVNEPDANAGQAIQVDTAVQ